jgi:hypothetical protein
MEMIIRIDSRAAFLISREMTFPIKTDSVRLSSPDHAQSEASSDPVAPLVLVPAGHAVYHDMPAWSW